MFRSGKTAARATVVWQHSHLTSLRRRKAHSRGSRCLVLSAFGGNRYSDVEVMIEETDWSSRTLFARVLVRSPVDVVWACLTDYERLGDFIPGLVVNKCLERTPNGCLLLQVGAQEVALGLKFSAACKLRCTEYSQGVPPELYTTSSTCSDGLFPAPRTSLGNGSRGSSGASARGNARRNSTSSSNSSSRSSNGLAAPQLPPLPRDITFNSVEGDFQTFRGVWRLQACPDSGYWYPGSSGDVSTSSGSTMFSDSEGGSSSGGSSGGDVSEHTLLCYALFVRPQAWLPVGLIQNRIRAEVLRNLDAVRRRSEDVYTAWRWRQTQQGAAQQPPRQGGGAGGSAVFTTQGR